MGIRKLEKKEPISLEEIINRGGEVVADKARYKKEWVNFCLRVPAKLLIEIDNVIEERIGISKTVWILEAIQEKLRKDNG